MQLDSWVFSLWNRNTFAGWSSRGLTSSVWRAFNFIYWKLLTLILTASKRQNYFWGIGDLVSDNKSINFTNHGKYLQPGLKEMKNAASLFTNTLASSHIFFHFKDCPLYDRWHVFIWESCFALSYLKTYEKNEIYIRRVLKQSSTW